ncbi:endonuclease/exonuclease/phosphatase family protein [Arthrobacter sp. TMN-37]
MRLLRRCSAALTAAVLLAAGGTIATGPAAVPASAAPAYAPPATQVEVAQDSPGAPSVRVATYNASLNRQNPGDLVRELSGTKSTQARAVAGIIQATAPDVVLLNEFDYDPAHRAAELFRTNYLAAGSSAGSGITYPYVYTAPSNTGVPSGMDLNNDGTVGGPDDALGYGAFEGQYGMVLYSKYPIDTANVRTFRNFLWKDMPGALLPTDPVANGADWFSAEELAQVRLSSKSHWDVPVLVGRKSIHLLASHPTPPVFDGREDRNGRRNNDEIRMWADYIEGGKTAAYLYDDQGRRGGLDPGERFVVLGDQNSDPFDGDSIAGSIDQLLIHRLVHDPMPSSDGAAEASALQGGANAGHRGFAGHDTADFEDQSAGNLRVDYVLPSKNLPVLGSGIFWPRVGTPGSELTGIFPFPSSDHRLVYVDLRVRGS